MDEKEREPEIIIGSYRKFKPEDAKPITDPALLESLARFRETLRRRGRERELARETMALAREVMGDNLVNKRESD